MRYYPKKVGICTGVCGVFLLIATTGILWFLNDKIKSAAED